MLLWLELRREHFAHDAIGIDHIGDSSRQKAEGFGHAELLANFALRVGKQCKWKVVLLCECFM